MRSVADPIHHAQDARRGTTVAGVIFDDNGFSRDPSGLFDQDHRVGGMMEYVHKHDCVEAVIRKGQRFAVKSRHWNVRLRSDQHVHALERKVGPSLEEYPVDRSIAASYVKYGGRLRQHIHKMIYKHSDPPATCKPGMQSANH